MYVLVLYHITVIICLSLSLYIYIYIYILTLISTARGCRLGGPAAGGRPRGLGAPLNIVTVM